MQCGEIDLEAIADGTRPATSEEHEHLLTCAACARALEFARAIENTLAARDVPTPPPAFTAGVMAQIGAARWQAERIVDFSFNLALAIGLLVIVGSGVGLAWSFGLFAVAIDREAIDLALSRFAGGQLSSQLQTTVLAAVVLLITLGLWWWVESDSAV